MKTYFIPALVCCFTIIVSGLNAADIDTVFRISDPKPVAGEITSATKTEVVVTQKVGNREEKIPVNDISSVEWKVEPPTLGLARSNEKAGHLSEALTGYQTALGAAEAKDLKAEVQFLIARTAAKVAQADPTQLPTALEKLKAFVGSNRDHFRFYHAQALLGETALTAGDYVAADGAFQALAQSPWNDYKMAGETGSARSLLAQGKVVDALAIFNTVAGKNVTSKAETARKLEAMLGQARCQQQQSQIDDATKTLQQVVDQTTARDTRLLAEAYVQLGDCYAADGQKNKEAVLAYLHVDVIPALAAHGDLHAEALYHLVKLWPAIGQPARAADAAATMEQEYPNSEWAKKLGSGS